MSKMLRFALSMTQPQSAVILKEAKRNEGAKKTMKPIGTHNYFVYIVTNYNKTVLYVGVTNNLRKRIYEHEQDAKQGKKHFAGKYNTIYLIYFERFQYIEHAIKREKQIKGWIRKKKEIIISAFNKEWKFLNDEIE